MLVNANLRIGIILTFIPVPFEWAASPLSLAVLHVPEAALTRSEQPILEFAVRVG